MEPAIPMDESSNDGDFCSWLLSHFGDSSEESHQHLCSTIATISQELRDRGLPLSPIAYFGAASASLRVLSAEADLQRQQPHKIDALLTILSLLLPRLPAAVLRKKKTREPLAELLILVLPSKPASAAAAAAGLKCVSHLLVVGHDESWSNASQLYSLLLGFAADSRPKVRRQSHMCIHDVLQSFRGTSMQLPASEAISKIFERFLLLAGGSNPTASEGPKGAQEVLYVLQALKEWLPFMSSRSVSSTLKYFKTLLELRNLFVSRRVKDCLSAICLSHESEFPPEFVLDLLCFIALNVPADASADDKISTACLMDAGMRNVYLLSRQTCVVKLPIIFNALKDVLASEYTEAVLAAMEAMKSLIHSCIDKELIKQGVEQIKISANSTRSSGPTIIEKLCATMESLLHYGFSAVWDMSFQVISALFDKLGEDSSYLLKETLESLAELQMLPEEDFPYRKQLFKCVGSALSAMGPESFLSILPLKLEAEDISQVNVWLFPILKQYTVGAHLSFFKESILGMVAQMRQKSRTLELEGRIFSSRSTNALAYSLWSLLPSFCNYPRDTAQGFGVLAKTLCRALHEEPDVVGIICSALQTLIRQNKQIPEGIENLSDVEASTKRAMNHYTSQVVAQNMSVLRSSAREFLSVLSGIFLKSTKDAGGCLQSTIWEFASISDKEVVSKFFKNALNKLLKATLKAAGNSSNSNSMQIEKPSDEGSTALARARLFDLVVSLLPGLDSNEIGVLFSAIKPALKDSDGLIQKKAFKVLSIILKNSDNFLSLELDELLQLMIEVLPLCHFSAKRHRLECLYSLIVHVSKDEFEQKQHNIISSFLTEIILALKEANKKTRNRAYDLLVQIGHAFGDEDKGGRNENLHQYFYMVAGGLAGETPHMISAAVKGLARLAYEFTDLVSAAYNVLPSTFLLLQRKNREIIKANLGLLKVLVARSHADALQAHLKAMVEGLLKWQDNTKNQFKAKVKLLLEMLVKKCGLDAVKAVMPEEHMKLLTNIRKMAERKKRKETACSEETRSQKSKATTSRMSRWNHTNIFSDFGDEETDDGYLSYMDANTISSLRSKSGSRFKSKAASMRSKAINKAAKSLTEDLFDQLENEPLDLLDRQKTRSALCSSEHKKRKQESDDEPEIDSEGRLVIRESAQFKREAPSDLDLDDRSQAGSYLSVNSSGKMQKRRKTSDSGWAYSGSEYANKKAGGDVKRKGKLEPYAYWPLDRKMLSRRREHRMAARKGMASVVKLTKKLEGKSSAAALSSRALRIKSKATKKTR